ncbi:MAG: hypothetical protein LBM20_04015 [Rikenellaceae bacterium]|jgi:hypothetical protein|nr:hypothetical protein [Rikenellaceae bacterium]
MYSKRPYFIFGFHGCEKSVRDKIVSNQERMKRSENSYDWLGSGFYFWENDHDRALQFAKEKGFNDPAVLGACIDLGNCLDLLEFHQRQRLKDAYNQLKTSCEIGGITLPENSTDLMRRKLDCAVVKTHVENQTAPKVDSVRGVFWEGEILYPGAGLKEKNHIQICVRNPDCIKAFFIPRTQEKAKFQTDDLTDK